MKNVSKIHGFLDFRNPVVINRITGYNGVLEYLQLVGYTPNDFGDKECFISSYSFTNTF